MSTELDGNDVRAALEKCTSAPMLKQVMQHNHHKVDTYCKDCEQRLGVDPKQLTI